MGGDEGCEGDGGGVGVMTYSSGSVAFTSREVC